MNETSWARALFLGFFVLLLVAVFLLPRDYVFRGAPDRRAWRDLRFWALLVVLIHVWAYWRF